MQLHHLRILAMIARHGSLSAAASALDYTQATVSHHLAALETELGTALVDRGRYGAVLNDRGRALLPHAEAVLSRLDGAVSEVRALAGLRSGVLRIGTFPTAGAQLLPRAVARFMAEHPAVELAIVEDEPAVTLPALLAGERDLVVVFTLPTGQPAVRLPVELHHLSDDALRVVLPVGHRLTRSPRVARAPLPLSALRDERWITGVHAGDPCAQLLHDACARAGFVPNIVLRSDDYEVIRGFVAAGVGIALVPDLGLAHISEPLEIRDLAGPPLVRGVYAALPRAGASAAARELLGLLAEVARGDPAAGPVMRDRHTTG